MVKPPLRKKKILLVVPRDENPFSASHYLYGQTAITKKENSAQVMPAESPLSCSAVGLNFEDFSFG